MTDVDLDSLEAAAEDALKRMAVAGLPSAASPYVQIAGDYLRVANPAAVLSLIARIRELEAEIAAWDSTLGGMQKDLEAR